MFQFTAAQAQGIPVYDNSQNLNQLQEIAHMIEQIDTLQKQYDAQLDAIAAVTGTRDMGSFANGDLEYDMRRYAPDDMGDLLNIMNAGSLPSSTSGVKGTYSNLKNQYAPLTTAEINPYNPDYPTAKAYEQQTNSTYAAIATSEAAYNTASARRKTYEDMLEELDKAPDMKASADLQVRSTIENGLVLAELTRLIALQTQLLAAQSNQELTTRREAYDDNQYPISE